MSICTLFSYDTRVRATIFTYQEINLRRGISSNFIGALCFWETCCSLFKATAKSSIPCVKPKSSLKDGGTITTPNDHTVHWVTAHLRQRPSCSWTKGQSSTNFQIGPLKWGCSGVQEHLLQDAIRPFLEIGKRSKNELSTNAYYNIKNEQHH